MNNLNIDQVIDHVKIIAENVRCAVCDKLDGCRMRYFCGHTACGDCISDAHDCLICLTPPPALVQPKYDKALTQRVKNSTALLKACQDLFNIDVYKYRRISEQLKIEKELFPKCIQAPVKYENKRKSSNLNLSNKNKENRTSTYFLGEDISHFKENRMENSVNYVQQWLNKNEKDLKRKPFTDLQVNTTNHSTSHNVKTVQNGKDKVIPILTTNRKRTHHKVKNSNNANLREKSINENATSKRIKTESKLLTKDIAKDFQKSISNFDDNKSIEDPIVIDDSQETYFVEKDQNAWLAVLEADQNEVQETTSVVNIDSDKIKLLDKPSTVPNESQCKDAQGTKVPFYKKSIITETCEYCKTNATAGQSKEVNITIDSDSFTTTITILSNIDNSNKLSTTNSVSIQTDICGTFQMNDNIYIKDSDMIDLDIKDKKNCLELQGSMQKNINLCNEEKKNRNCLVIEESDSDLEMERSGPLTVEADVHSSYDNSTNGILSQVVDIHRHSARPRRKARGLTPTSTDSSDKENYNPNRLKKNAMKKKKSTKK